MSHVRYIISDASKQVELEPHVLRYWEEELDLEIPRNEMGHRYYREEELEIIRGIKRLKEEGFQLKAIKMVLPELSRIEQLDADTKARLCNELNERVSGMEAGRSLLEPMDGATNLAEGMDNKMEQFQTIMSNLIRNALQENNQTLANTVSGEVTNSVIKEMDYCLRVKEEREEEHYKKIDEALRAYQQGKKEAAVTEHKGRRKRRFFKKED